jgi:hypothetical protein
LDNSLKPSAIACNKPQKPTILGPLRRCIEANNLRSKIVKKATANKTKTIKGIVFIKKKL